MIRLPVELSEDVIKLEQMGADPTRSFLSRELLEAYVRNRMATHSRSEIVDLSENFFRLGPNWIGLLAMSNFASSRNDLTT